MGKARGLRPNGGQIRSLRRTLGLTQEQFAASCDCTPRTIRSAEKGNALDASTLSRLAKALRVPVPLLCAEIIDSAEIDRNRQIAMEWEDAFFHADLERLLSLHHPDVITELPGSHDLPGGGDFIGIDQLRAHLKDVFSTFRYLTNNDVEFTAAGNKVFQRSHSTWQFLPAQKEFTSVFINEFTFQDSMIVHRRSVSDLSPLHKLIDAL